jgi:hypothetical protein
MIAEEERNREEHASGRRRNLSIVWVLIIVVVRFPLVFPFLYRAWSNVNPERIKMPKRGVNRASLKI